MTAAGKAWVETDSNTEATTTVTLTAEETAEQEQLGAVGHWLFGYVNNKFVLLNSIVPMLESYQRICLDHSKYPVSAGYCSTVYCWI